MVALEGFGDEIFAPWNGATSQLNKPIRDPIFDYLFYVDVPAGKFSPGLADSWSVEQDGLKWTLRLREGVTFRDGPELTAADLKFLIEKLTDPESTAALVATWQASVDTVTEVGKYEVTVSLKKPFAEIVEQLSNYRFFPIVSKAHFETVGETGFEANPIGSGPYTVEDVDKGAAYRFSAVDQHWRVGTPGFKELTIVMIPEPAIRFAALRTGEVDVAPLPVSFTEPVREENGLRPINVPGATTTGLLFIGKLAPTHAQYDPALPLLKLEVRKALNLAVNRQELVDTIMEGNAVPGTMFPYLTPGWQGVEPYAYDPDQAKQLLAEAGYPQGLELRVWSFAVEPENPTLIQATCGYWQAIGVNCKIEPIEFGAFIGKFRGLADPSIVGDLWAFSRTPGVDYETGMRAVMLAESPFPQMWEKEAEDLVLSLGETFDPVGRGEIYRQIGQIHYEQYSSIPLVVPNSLVAVRDTIAEDWQPIIMGVIGGWETLRASGQ